MLVSTLQKKLNMSYKIVSIQPPKTKFKEHIHAYWESVMIQCTLAKRWFEVIYIDEFSISEHRSKFGIWSFKEFKLAITWNIDNFFYVLHFNSFWKAYFRSHVKWKSKKAEVFIYFLSEHIEIQNIFFKEDIRKT